LGPGSSSGVIFLDRAITEYDAQGGTTQTIEDEDERRVRERLAVARRRARCRAWRRNRLRNHLLEITPMKGIANDCPGYQEKANRKNGADTVGKPVAMFRAVFF
jgi:hypothetical protein